MSECVTCGGMWASLCVRVNWACSYVSVLMCFSVFIHMSEFVSMFMLVACSPVSECITMFICVRFLMCTSAFESLQECMCMCECWSYACTWLLMNVLVTRFTVCICALVHLCVQITVWVYTSDHVSVFEWKCKHVMYVHDYEWMYALYFCFSTFFLELMCKQVCQ